MLELVQTSTSRVESVVASRTERARLVPATDPALDVPEDPAAYAQEHPSTVAHELYRWRERPGLLAHAILAAAEFGDVEQFGPLGAQLAVTFHDHPQPYVREAVLLAWHAVALRARRRFCDIAVSALEAATRDTDEAVRATATELLESLQVSTHAHEERGCSGW